jgi:transposase-like protein
MARFKRDKDPNKAVDFWLTQAGLALISGWKQDGMSVKQIAKEMGITEQCLHGWAKLYDEVYKAIHFGVQEVQYQVEDALTRAALGGRVEETKVTTLMKNGQVVEQLKEQFTKEIQPDVRAIKIYLMNRAPKKWQQDKLALLTDDGEDSHIQVVVHKHITEAQEAEEEQQGEV